MSILPPRNQIKQNHLRIRPFNLSQRTHRRGVNQKCVLLLFILILIHVAFFFGKLIGECEYNIKSTDYDAVVIGAGWAGLKALQTLLDSGISSILVLEANGYIGGRAKSINTNGPVNSPDLVGASDNIPTETGCEWLYLNYGQMEKTLKNSGMIEPVFANDHRKKRYSIDFHNAVYYAQTVNANGITETKVVENITTTLKERVWDTFYIEKPREDESYADAIESFKKRYVLSDSEENYLNLMKSIIQTEYAGDAAKISASDKLVLRSYTHYTSIPGLGFGNIAAKYAEPFKSKIKLNANVIEVNYLDKQKNIITYIEDGLTKKVSADAVLVTVPLGVLKANTIKFIPSFPAWKQDVIDNMGFGVLNKCIMQWNYHTDIVWPKDEYWLELITPDAASSDKWTTFFNPTSFKHVPVLVGFISGQAAIDTESQTDDEIMEDVMRNLKAMYPSIRKPDKIVITRWGKENTARGSYAFKKINRNWEDDKRNLQKRIDRLWFAGEATFKTPGTTVAAWETGETAARSMASALMGSVLRHGAGGRLANMALRGTLSDV